MKKTGPFRHFKTSLEVIRPAVMLYVRLFRQFTLVVVAGPAKTVHTGIAIVGFSTNPTPATSVIEPPAATLRAFDVWDSAMMPAKAPTGAVRGK